MHWDRARPQKKPTEVGRDSVLVLYVSLSLHPEQLGIMLRLFGPIHWLPSGDFCTRFYFHVLCLIGNLIYLHAQRGRMKSDDKLSEVFINPIKSIFRHFLTGFSFGMQLNTCTVCFRSAVSSCYFCLSEPKQHMHQQRKIVKPSR